MADANPSTSINLENTTNSTLPTGEISEAIELIEEARGVLECLDMLGDLNVNIDLSGLEGKQVIERMSKAAAAAARLVVDAQAFLIEAKVVEPEARHG